MSRRKILFFSCEPGGAEVLIPVISMLHALPRIEVSVTGYGYALERFSKKSIAYTEIAPISLENNYLFERYAPDMIITSAASLPAIDMSEKYLWRQAKQRGIPSLAFLDQWQNYVARFSGAQANERLAYLPDWINCMNEIGRMEMLGAGFDAAKLLTLGHPYLSSLRRDFPKLDITALRAAHGIAAREQVALFVSEAIREHYGIERGYDQYQVLDYFLSNFDKEFERPKILIKLHPKDCPASFLSIANKYRDLRVQLICNELSPLDCLAIADFIFGMSSVMLIEAYILGKRVASLQPGLRVEDPMVLSKYKLIPCVTSFTRCNPLQLDFRAGERFDVEFCTTAFVKFMTQAMGAPHSFEGEIRR